MKTRSCSPHQQARAGLEDIGLPDFEGCVEALQGLIAEVYGTHRSLLDGPTAPPWARMAVERFLYGTASRTELRAWQRRER